MKAKRWDFESDIMTQEHDFYFLNCFGFFLSRYRAVESG